MDGSHCALGRDLRRDRIAGRIPVLGFHPEPWTTGEARIDAAAEGRLPPAPHTPGPCAVEEGVGPRDGARLVGDELEQPAADGQLSDPAAPRESAGPGGRPERHRANADERLLAELAKIDELALERDAEWKRLAQRLDALRREIATTSAQIQRSRSLAAHMPSRDEDADEVARQSARTRDEDRGVRLMQGFEAALREAEERRVAFHAEMEDLRHRRQALLRRLPAAISRPYQSLADAGRVPAIAAVAKGICGGCESPLTESVIEALSHGAVAVCARCERLLMPSVPRAGP